MKIDLSAIDLEQFMVHQHWIGEHECFLVQPQHIGARWDRKNLIFRSSLWDKSGGPVSLSFSKFFNWDEKPDLDTPPSNLNGAQLMEKLDGSTLIFSRYKGHTVIRTRGTSDARKQENGYEIDYLCEKYPKLIKLLEKDETSACSFIMEWLSPTNRIVLNYGEEPDMVLVGMVIHSDYSYVSQAMLDEIANDLGLRRPRTFNYNSIDEMKQSIEALRNQEGICVYYNNGQSIRKVKSADYLYKHRAKSDIASIEKVIDLYFNLFTTTGRFPTYQEFFDYLSKTFDYEIAVMARGHASNIADGIKQVEKIIVGISEFMQPVYGMNRKDAAGKILQAYGTTGRSSIVFKLLDGKVVGSDDYKKLLYQVLKN